MSYERTTSQTNRSNLVKAFCDVSKKQDYLGAIEYFKLLVLTDKEAGTIPEKSGRATYDIAAHLTGQRPQSDFSYATLQKTICVNGGIHAAAAIEDAARELYEESYKL